LVLSVQLISKTPQGHIREGEKAAENDTEALTQYLEYLARDVEQIFRPGGPPK